MKSKYFMKNGRFNHSSSVVGEYVFVFGGPGKQAQSIEMLRLRTSQHTRQFVTLNVPILPQPYHAVPGPS